MTKTLQTTVLRYMLLLLPLLLPACGMAQQSVFHTPADTLRARFRQLVMPEAAATGRAQQRLQNILLQHQPDSDNSDRTAAEATIPF